MAMWRARLRKIAEGKADATLLAAAGLERLGIAEFEGLTFTELPVNQVVPAPGAGGDCCAVPDCRSAKVRKSILRTDQTGSLSGARFPQSSGEWLPDTGGCLLRRRRVSCIPPADRLRDF